MPQHTAKHSRDQDICFPNRCLRIDLLEKRAFPYLMRRKPYALHLPFCRILFDCISSWWPLRRLRSLQDLRQAIKGLLFRLSNSEVVNIVVKTAMNRLESENSGMTTCFTRSIEGSPIKLTPNRSLLTHSYWRYFVYWDLKAWSSFVLYLSLIHIWRCRRRG